MTKQDALDKFHKRDFSWSQMSSFAYNPEQWYKSYILGEYQDSEELRFGKMIDLKIQEDPTFMPSLPRYEKMQHKMKVVFNKIPLVGVPDGINFTTTPKILSDYKTGRNPWTQKKAKETGQLKFYLLLIYITEKIKPEEFDCYIHWLPTKLEENGNFERKISLISDTEFQTFKVNHTMRDILTFGTEIIKTYIAMEKYIAQHSHENE